ncbi:hypothetical protein [Microbulbifer agarilyticus]|uniref:hypothetical protein n=1 Tax=Microbulbifer agarilyticus TaxID=260552 RepID=UPI001CD7FE9E|nr:hypothetical protein [Microbulbifer agarilyticus]MCA0899549.1 hypothetical protein [Microbulbifer agarilyticus]
MTVNAFQPIFPHDHYAGASIIGQRGLTDVVRQPAATVGDSWSGIIVIYNSVDNYTHSLPAGEWKVAMKKSDPAAGNGRVVSGSVVLEGTAMTMLYRD